MGGRKGRTGGQKASGSVWCGSDRILQANWRQLYRADTRSKK